MPLRIKRILLSISMVGIFAVPTLATAPAAYAAYPQSPTPTTCSATPTTTGCPSSDINNNLCGGSNFQISGGTTKDCTDSTTTGLGPKIAHLINIFSALIGIVAVVVIIYAGFRYVTSAGNEAGVKAAKNAIIYALIGLVVVALAQAIVHFVINGING